MYDAIYRGIFCTNRKLVMEVSIEKMVRVTLFMMMSVCVLLWQRVTQNFTVIACDIKAHWERP